MEVLFIGYYSPPLGLSGPIRTWKPAKYLIKKGYQCGILTVKPITYMAYDFESLEEIKKDGVKLFRAESLDPLRIFYILTGSKTPALPKGKKRSIIDFFLRRFFFPDNKIFWVPFALYKLFGIWRKFKFKIIFSTSPPYSSHIVGLIFKLIKKDKVKWIADFQDIYTVSYGKVYFKKGQDFLRKIFAQKADLVVSSSYNVYKSIKKGIVYYHCYDPEDVKKVENVKEGNYIVYAGNVKDREKILEYVLDALPDNLNLVVCGVANPEWVKKMENTGKFIYTGYLSKIEMNKWLKRAKILLVVLSDEMVNMPFKLGDYLGFGKPVLIVTKNAWEAFDFFKRYFVGKAVKPDREKIKDAIEFILKNKDKMEFEKVKKEFSWESFVKKIFFDEIKI